MNRPGPSVSPTDQLLFIVPGVLRIAYCIFDGCRLSYLF